MPKAGLSHRIRLRDTLDANDVGLVLHERDDGTFAYGWDLAPALAPDVEQKDVNYGEFRPELQLTWSQSDWSGGALQFYFDPKKPNRYSFANDVWTMTRNEFSGGATVREIPFGIKNGGQETGGSSEWTASGGSLAVATASGSSVYSGQKMWRGTNWAQNNTMTHTVDLSTDQPAARWQSQTVVFRGRLALGSGASGTMRLNIVESGGASTPTTNGSGVSITDTVYKNVTVTVAIQSDTTGIQLQVERTDGGAAATFNFDTMQFFAGTVDMNKSHLPMMEFGADVLLAFTDRAVWKLNTDEDYFMLQKVFGAAITGAAIYDDRLYIGQGESTAYEFSDVADPTTFTTSTLTGTTKNANRFIVTQNVNANYALAKTLNDDELFLATDPTNSGAWGSALDVGKDDYDITNVHLIGDSLAIGKEDGLYQYLSLEGDRLSNIYPNAVMNPSLNNFSRGANHQGDFFTVVGDNQLLKWNGVNWRDLSSLIDSPGFPDIGNAVRAIGSDGRRLWLLAQEPVADSLTKTTWLFALEEFQDGTWSVHTISQIKGLFEGLTMIVSKAAETNSPYLYISGGTYGSGSEIEALVMRMRLPNRTNTPRHNAAIQDHSLSGALLYTSYMDWGWPNVIKSFNKFTLLSEDLTSSIRARVSYQIDDDTSTIQRIGTTGNFTTSPSETITMTTGLTGRRIRFLFDMTQGAQVAAVVKGFFLEASWRPGRLKRWQVTCGLEDGQRTLKGAETPLKAQVILARLRLLEKETSPIKFDDIDGVENNVHITNMGERMIMPATAEAGQRGARYKRVIDLELTEAF